MADNVELKQIQYRLKRMMGVFHDFLEENSISYFIMYGSLLGAVRHSGFIPWDDDFDIGMLREDYERLLKLCDKIPEPYVLKARGLKGTDKNFPYLYAKLEDSKTLLIEKNIEFLKLKSGLYIDVFVFDRVPKGFVKRFFAHKSLLFWLNVRKLLLMNDTKKRSFLKRIPISLANKLFKLESVLKRLDRLGRIAENEDSDELCAYSGMYDSFEPIFPREALQMGDKISFEEYAFRSVKDADLVLKLQYGSYMSLPKEEDRVPHHNYSLEFLP